MILPGSLSKTRQMQVEEEAQWISAAQNNLAHFEPLYQRYYKPIYEFVYRRCEDADDCMDIVSVVFEKAMVNIGKYRNQGWPFSSWLYRIASSEIGNYYRKVNKERKVYIQTEGIKDIASDLESTATDEEQLQLLLSALEKLKPEDVELLVMRYFEKRSITEIAAIGATTESNCRVRLHRVISRLRDAFEKAKKL